MSDHLTDGLENLQRLRNTKEAGEFLKAKMQELGINPRRFDVNRDDPLFREFKKLPSDLAFTVFRASFVRHIDIHVLAKKMAELLASGAIAPGDIEALTAKTAYVCHIDVEAETDDDMLPPRGRIITSYLRVLLATQAHYLICASASQESGDDDGYRLNLDQSAETAAKIDEIHQQLMELRGGKT